MSGHDRGGPSERCTLSAGDAGQFFAVAERGETVHEAALRNVCALRNAALAWKAEHGGDMRSRAEADMWGYVHSVLLEHYALKAAVPSALRSTGEPAYNQNEASE